MIGSVKKAGKNNPMLIVLKSPAFNGYSLKELTDNFGGTPGKANATLVEDKLTIIVPEISGLTVGQEQIATFKLYVSGELLLPGLLLLYSAVSQPAHCAAQP